MDERETEEMGLKTPPKPTDHFTEDQGQVEEHDGAASRPGGKEGGEQDVRREPPASVLS